MRIKGFLNLGQNKSGSTDSHCLDTLLVDTDSLNQRSLARGTLFCRIEDTLHIKKVDEEFFE
jgi:hypothetical protein